MQPTEFNSYLAAATPNWSGTAQHDSRDNRAFALLRDPNGEDATAHANLKSEISFLETPRGTPPLFVSYYTENTPYEALANRLRASLDRLNLPHRIEAVPSQGSWVANTGLKSAFIERCWAETDSPICWIDADAEILRTPHFVFDSPFDFGIVRRKGWYDISSFVYFGKAPVVGEMIQNWAQMCRDNTNIWDQALLTLAWYKTAQTGQISNLWMNDGIFRFPRPFVRDLRDRIFYYPYNTKIRPFVDQKQASNDLKAFVDTSKRKDNELGSDDICPTFQRALSTGSFELPATVDSMFGL